MNEEVLLDHKNTLFKNTVRVFQDTSMIQDSAKAEEFIEKIANNLEEEYSYLLQENLVVAKNILNTYFNDKFKPVVNENLRKERYSSFEDYDKEAENFRVIFIREMRDKITNVELLVDQIFIRFNSLTYKEISSSKHRKMELELAATKERLRIAEEDIQRERKEMTTMQSTMDRKISHLEN